ncbi:MAG: sel1 repeat family protein [Pseudomonadota bacterium]
MSVTPFSVSNEATLPPISSAADLYRMGLAASTGSGGQALDYVTAHKWFNLAAMKGNKEALAYRAELAREMTSADIAEAQRQARQWLLENEGGAHN